MHGLYLCVFTWRVGQLENQVRDLQAERVLYLQRLDAVEGGQAALVAELASKAMDVLRRQLQRVTTMRLQGV